MLSIMGKWLMTMIMILVTVMLTVLTMLNDVGYNGDVDDGVCEQHRPCVHQWRVVGCDYHRNLVQETLLWKQTVSKC